MYTTETLNNSNLYSNVSSEYQSSVFPVGWVIFGVCAGLGVLITVLYFCVCAKSSSRRHKSIKTRQRLGTRGGGTTTEDWNMGQVSRNVIVSTNESNHDNQPGDCSGGHPVGHHGSHHHNHHGGISGHDSGTCNPNHHGSHSNNHHGNSGCDFGGHTSSHHGGFSGHDSSSPSGYDGGGFSSGGGDFGGGGCSSGW